MEYVKRWYSNRKSSSYEYKLHVVDSMDAIIIYDYSDILTMKNLIMYFLACRPNMNKTCVYYVIGGPYVSDQARS